MKTYVVSGDILQAVLNTLSKMPYQDVNILINEILKLNEQHPEVEEKKDVIEGELVDGQSN